MQEKLENDFAFKTELADKAGLYYNPESELGASYRIGDARWKTGDGYWAGFRGAAFVCGCVFAGGFEVIKMRFEKTAEDRK